MFGSKKKEDELSLSKFNNGKSSPNSLNSLVSGATLEGNVNAESDFRIDGQFIGNLICKAKVIVGPSGIFEGEMRAENAVIEGHVTGKIQIVSTLEMKESGNISGEVSTDKLIIAGGAKFNAICQMNGSVMIHKNESPRILASPIV